MQMCICMHVHTRIHMILCYYEMSDAGKFLTGLPVNQLNLLHGATLAFLPIPIDLKKKTKQKTNNIYN